jgi:hypothetical protein
LKNQNIPFFKMPHIKLHFEKPKHSIFQNASDDGSLVEPIMGPSNLKKISRLNLKPLGSAGETLADPLPMSLTWGCQQLVRLGLLLWCVDKNTHAQKIASYPFSPHDTG